MDGRHDAPSPGAVVPSNVFILSPGRTGTMTLARVLARLPGYSSGHETRCSFLGGERLDYPRRHIECDNRLVWFLPRLTARFRSTGALVVVHRTQRDTAASHARRWYRVNMIKAYSQGILKRDFTENTLEVCEDYVNNVYEQIAFAEPHWGHVVHIDIAAPEAGVKELLALLGCENHAAEILDQLAATRENMSRLSLKNRLAIIRFSLRNLLWDLRQCLRPGPRH